MATYKLGDKDMVATIQVSNVLCAVRDGKQPGRTYLSPFVCKSPEVYSAIRNTFHNLIPLGKFSIINNTKRVEVPSTFKIECPPSLERIWNDSWSDPTHRVHHDLMWVPMTLDLVHDRPQLSSYHRHKEEESLLDPEITVTSARVSEPLVVKYTGNEVLGYIDWKWTEKELADSVEEYKEILEYELSELGKK